MAALGMRPGPVMDPATERRKSGLFQAGAASARARRPFRDWDASPTSAHRIFFSELSGTMYAICG